MLKDLVFLHGAHTEHCDATVDKRFEGYSTLQFISGGAVELYYGLTRYELHGHCFWTAAPGPWIRFHAAPGYDAWNHRYVAFDGTLVNRWKAENLWPETPQQAPPERDYPPLFDELIDNAKRGDRWGTMRATALLESILIDLAEVRAQSAPAEPWLEIVLAELDAAPDFAPNYDHLAAQCGMALSTLRRRFREITGITLHNYVMQKRITNARALLGDTDLPIKQVAEKLGYNDVYFFSNQFRQQAGVSPAAYRRSRQA